MNKLQMLSYKFLKLYEFLSIKVYLHLTVILQGGEKYLTRNKKKLNFLKLRKIKLNNLINIVCFKINSFLGPNKFISPTNLYLC